eukprot:gene19119-biopygen933
MCCFKDVPKFVLSPFRLGAWLAEPRIGKLPCRVPCTAAARAARSCGSPPPGFVRHSRNHKRSCPLGAPTAGQGSGGVNRTTVTRADLLLARVDLVCRVAAPISVLGRCCSRGAQLREPATRLSKEISGPQKELPARGTHRRWHSRESVAD